MSQLALPGPDSLADLLDAPPPRDRQFALSAGTSLLLHGGALALLLITWHVAPKNDPALQAIPVTLVKAEDTAPAAIEAPKPTPQPDAMIERATPPASPTPPVEAAPKRVAKPPPAPHVATPAPAPAPAPPHALTAVPHTNDDITALLQEGVGGHPLTDPERAGRGAAQSGIAIRSSAKLSDDYLIKLQNWIARFQNYPRNAAAKHEQGKGVVGFTVARDGRVVKVWTDTGTGTSDLDDASIAMVHAASPVPPLPNDLPDATVDFYFPVSYTLSNYQRLFQ